MDLLKEADHAMAQAGLVEVDGDETSFGEANIFMHPKTKAFWLRVVERGELINLKAVEQPVTTESFRESLTHAHAIPPAGKLAIMGALDEITKPTEPTTKVLLPIPLTA